MTVAELIGTLRGYPADAAVVLSSDSTGNRFNHIEGVGIITFANNKNEAGGHEVLDADMYREKEPMERVVGLWPIPS